MHYYSIYWLTLPVLGVGTSPNEIVNLEAFGDAASKAMLFDTESLNAGGKCLAIPVL